MRLETVMPTLNDDQKYRFHLAKTNDAGAKPLDSLMDSEEAWLGWHTYKGNDKERFVTDFVVSFAQNSEGYFVFGGVIKIISRNGKEYQVEYSEQHKDLMGRILIEYHGENKRSTVYKPNYIFTNCTIKDIYISEFNETIDTSSSTTTFIESDEKSSDEPNIFELATKELSQDAFIAWLLKWSDPNFNGIIHDIGNRFLLDLIRKYSEFNLKFQPPKTISCIDVKLQYKNIDILAIINNEYLIIIEDKTSSSEHSDQLSRYKNEAEKFELQNGHKIDGSKIVLIYLKTGEQSSLIQVKKDGFAPYLRKDLLAFINQNNNIHPIYDDFRNYLNKMNQRFENWKNTSLDKWKPEAWIGFYQEIKKHLDPKNEDRVMWGYTANPSGGFMCFWWNNSSQFGSEFTSYLQIESDEEKPKFVFKINVKEAKMYRKFRDSYSKFIIDNTNEQFAKPTRFGNGACMTVAVLKNEFRTINQNGIINIAETINTIKKYEQLHSELAAKFVTDMKQ